MKLDTYNHKRDFTRTGEPPGTDTVSSTCRRRFVVQEHRASHLHYDFRLEIGGVLVSWAVPKGPPPTPGVRRLAMKTEDHPLSYIDFHGTIAPGNYGAGEVSLWDSGEYEPVEGEGLEDGVRRGKIVFRLFGDRLTGTYDLVRIDDDKDEWLFLKSRDMDAGGAAPITRTFSAASAPAAPMPSAGSIQPMLAVPVARAFSHPDWRFEIKWDGYRALLYSALGGESLVSRNGLVLSGSFPELAALRTWLDCESAVIDGEIVALAPDGRPHFQTLQRRTRSTSPSAQAGGDAALVYMVFDLLHCDGRDLMGLPLSARRDLLERIVRPGGPVRYSDHIVGEGNALFERLSAMGMEGMMAKRADSPYVQRRSEHWAKIKTHRTLDVVVGGYTDSRTAARPFGSLLIGLYAGRELISVGHVGSGFNGATMRSLKQAMSQASTAKCPFAQAPRTNGPAHWVRPKTVCEVSFAEMTAGGALRHPVFMQLRPDKAATECQVTSSMVQSDPETGAKRRASRPAKSAPSEALAALAAGSSVKDATVRVDGHKVALSHLDKVYWPRTGTTKRDLLRYYRAVSGALLPHLADRPLMVQRFPDGVDGKSFFQHDTGSILPEYARTYEVVEHGRPIRYALCNDLATLLSLINLGAIPLHVWNCPASAPHTPDRIVFDFDPAGDFSTAVYAAHALRSVLDEIGLESYPKTSGASGLHVVVPIRPLYDSAHVVSFARLVGEATRQRMPDLITLERRIKNRGDGRLYLDCMQNGTGKTVAAPYSARPQPAPTVSTPLLWDEVSAKLNPALFTIETVPERLLTHGDLFAGILERPQLLAGGTDAAAEPAEFARSAQDVRQRQKART